MYVVTTTTLERELGIETLKKAIGAIEESISASKGQFSVKMEVCFVATLLGWESCLNINGIESCLNSRLQTMPCVCSVDFAKYC